MLELKAGDFVRHKNWSLFGNGRLVFMASKAENVTDKDTNPRWDIGDVFVYLDASLVKISRREFERVERELSSKGLAEPFGNKFNLCKGWDHVGRYWKKKKRHTRDVAKALALQHTKRFPKYEFNAYKCPYCKQYHFGKARSGRTRVGWFLFRARLFLKKLFTSGK